MSVTTSPAGLWLHSSRTMMLGPGCYFIPATVILWKAMCDSHFPDSETFTALLRQTQQGNPFAENAFYGMTSRRQRSIASALLRKERVGHTLPPTALVSEVFLKLRRLETRILGEEHFFRVAARAMQQVLIDSARAKFPRKRIPLNSSLSFWLIRTPPTTIRNCTWL